MDLAFGVLAPGRGDALASWVGVVEAVGVAPSDDGVALGETLDAPNAPPRCGFGGGAVVSAP